MDKAIQKVLVRSKVMNAFAEVGTTFSFAMISTYLSVYYTDVVGMAPMLVSIMMLTVRIFDAVLNPVVGGIAERTDSKWGRFRPYFLFGSPILAILLVLTFLDLGLSSAAQTFYCIVTYILFGAAYTVIDICKGSLVNVLSTDNNERMSFLAYKGIGGSIANFAVSAMAMPLILLFGKGKTNSANGYFCTTAIFALIGMVSVWIAFAGTKEVIKVKPNKEKVNLIKSYKTIFSDRDIVYTILGMVLFLMGFLGRYGVMAYYFIYVLEKPAMIAVSASIIAIASLLPNFIVPFLARHMDKKVIIMISCILVALGDIIFSVGGEKSVICIYAASFILGACNWVGISVFAITAELIDANQIKAGTRSDGTIYALITFGVQVGAAVGSSLGVAALSAIGFIANVQQSAGTVQGINIIVNVGPAIFALITIVPFSLVRMTNAKGKECSEMITKQS